MRLSSCSLAECDDKTLDKLLPETFADYRAGLEQRNAAIAAQERQRIGFDELRALYDQPGPVVTPLLRRGDALTPGPPVEPGVLSSLSTPVAFQWSPSPAEAKTSGRRDHRDRRTRTKHSLGDQLIDHVSMTNEVDLFDARGSIGDTRA